MPDLDPLFVPPLEWACLQVPEILHIPKACQQATNGGWTVVQILQGENALKMPVYVVVVNRQETSAI